MQLNSTAAVIKIKLSKNSKWAISYIMALCAVASAILIGVKPQGKRKMKEKSITIGRKRLILGNHDGCIPVRLSTITEESNTEVREEKDDEL